MHKEDIIKKAFDIIRWIEQVTNYHPGDDYYKSIYQQLNSLDEEKLQEAFVQIATIATDSINTTIDGVKKIERNNVIEKEKKEHLEEVKEMIDLLSF